jgi:hypothetical protein
LREFNRHAHPGGVIDYTDIDHTPHHTYCIVLPSTIDKMARNLDFAFTSPPLGGAEIGI